MFKRWLCLLGCALHYAIAGILIAWIVKAAPIGWGLLIADGVFLVVSAIVGIAFLKLNLDKLFQQFEHGCADKWDKVNLWITSLLALLVVGFEITMVAVYFIQGIKMQTQEWIRFTLAPNIVLAHLVLATGAYLGAEYFNTEALSKLQEDLTEIEEAPSEIEE